MAVSKMPETHFHVPPEVLGLAEEASSTLLTCGRDDPSLLAGMAACPGPGSWLIPEVLAGCQGTGKRQRLRKLGESHQGKWCWRWTWRMNRRSQRSSWEKTRITESKTVFISHTLYHRLSVGKWRTGWLRPMEVLGRRLCLLRHPVQLWVRSPGTLSRCRCYR